MSVNQYMTEAEALALENAVVKAYSPGISQEECADALMDIIGKVAHLMLSPNGTFQWGTWDVQSGMNYAVAKAAEKAHEEESVLSDLANGYKHCEKSVKHDGHRYFETIAGDTTEWECSGSAQQ